MSAQPLDELGKILMKRARDAAIAQWDKHLDGRMKGESAPIVRGILAGFSAAQMDGLRRILPAVVDTTLHFVLWAIEQERILDLTVKTAGGETVSAKTASDGLPGELYGPTGWIARFSQHGHELL